MKKTVVIGASPNPSRYAFMAVRSLKAKGIEVVPVGLRKGEIDGIPIMTEKAPIMDVHTVTLYVGPQNQAYWIDYILSLNPKRIIFNPGTYNDVLINRARKAGIETEMACTLVMLSTNEY